MLWDATAASPPATGKNRLSYAQRYNQRTPQVLENIF